jgi:hypothetical protein
VRGLTAHGRAPLALIFVGLLITAAGTLLEANAFLRSYLAAWLGWGAIPAGALALIMLNHLSGGHWGPALGRSLTAACRTLPWTGLLLLPVLLGLPLLYPWAQPGWAAPAGGQALYLETWFFVLRALLYFGTWIALAAFLLHGPQPLGRWPRPRPVAILGLVLYFLTATFAAVDWVKSVHPEFVSEVFGLLFIVHQGLAALSFAILLALLVERRRDAPLDELGDLLLAGVLTWGFLAFVQYLIIWSTDLAHQSAWYLVRLEGRWEVTAGAIVALHGVLPFFALLSPHVRNTAWLLCSVAALILAMRFVEMYWMVLPAYDMDPLRDGVAGLAAFLAVATLWLGALLWCWRSAPSSLFSTPEAARG